MVLTGCQSIPPAPVVPPQPDQPQSTTPSTFAEPAEARTSQKPGSTKSVSAQSPVSSRTIDISVRNWAFSPATLAVKKGEKVTLRLHGESGVHGFAVPDLGINQTVRPGEVVSVEVPTGKAGSYRFFCSVPCGKGHIDMKGMLTVGE